MYKIELKISLIFFLLGIISHAQKAAEPKTILKTWAEKVTPENVWQKYPRPQFQRGQWASLNGLWDVAIASNEVDKTTELKWEDKILAPFTVETRLSGIKKQMKDDEAIFYRRKLTVDKDWENKKILLHFDASDYETTVWIDNKKVGEHSGGYDRFSFDISKYVLDGKQHDLAVKVFDPQKSIFKSLGKQANGHEHYERCSGIWQSVWLEPVDKKAYLKDVKQVTTLKTVTFAPLIQGNPHGYEIKYEVFDDNRLVKKQVGPASSVTTISIAKPKLWSPDNPFLYTTTMTLMNKGKALDEVKSYFGIRTVEKVGKDFVLNGKPIFQVGPLDQNYWPGGGMTPPSEEAMLWEANYLKSIGCNMVRLHIKKNPDRFYYNYDKLGLLVWQDFICGQWGNRDPEVEQEKSWLEEQQKMISELYNHP